MTQGERITAVEVGVRELKEQFVEHQRATEKQFSDLKQQNNEINKKLDEVLALRNKGAGVLWVLSGVIGTGVLGGIAQLINWFHH